MIDFKFRTCYDFTGVTEGELQKLGKDDVMLNQCVKFILIQLGRPLESVYLYKVAIESDRRNIGHHWVYTNDIGRMGVVKVRDLLDTPVPFNYNEHKIIIL